MEEASAASRLDPAELAALRGAGVWYAKYHAHVVAEQADDEAAFAVGQREEYLALIAALNKLGVKIRPPEALAVSRFAA